MPEQAPWKDDPGRARVIPAGLFTETRNYGDSAQVGTGATAGQGWAQLLAAELRAPITGNTPIGGTALSLSTNAGGDRGYSQVLQDVAAAARTSGAPPFLAPTASATRPLHLIGSLFNDMLLNGGQAGIGRGVHALRGCLSTISAALLQEEDTIFVANGEAGAQFSGWTASGAQTDRNGGNGYYTANAAGAQAYRAPNGLVLWDRQAVALRFIVAAGATGTASFYTFRDGDSYPGVLRGTIPLADVAPSVAGKWGLGVFRFRREQDLSGSWRVRVIVDAPYVAGTFGIDAFIAEAHEPPPIIVRGVHRPSNASAYWATSAANRDADIATANRAIRALLAEFDKPGKPGPIFLDMDAVLRANPALFDVDGLHPNDQGYRLLADEARRLLADRLTTT